MKVVGIIAEYNPFHRGHEYQIRYAKETLGADYVIVATSGDFVQRGAPALMPKHLRAEMALLGGADLVLELWMNFVLAVNAAIRRSLWKQPAFLWRSLLYTEIFSRKISVKE